MEEDYENLLEDQAELHKESGQESVQTSVETTSEETPIAAEQTGENQDQMTQLDRSVSATMGTAQEVGQMMDQFHTNVYVFGFLVLVGLVFLIVLQAKILKALRTIKKR